MRRSPIEEALLRERWEEQLPQWNYVGCRNMRQCPYVSPCGLLACRQNDQCELDRVRHEQEAVNAYGVY